MRITEAYGKLDRRCVIAIKQNSGIFALISKLQKQIPTYIYDEEGGTYLQMFFDKSGKKTKDLSLILARKDVVEKSNYYSISERIDNIRGMNPISKILGTSSVVMNNSYISGDELTVDFNFHSSVGNVINGLLSGFVANDKNFRIARLERAGTLEKRLTEVHEETPVAMVRYSVRIPKILKIARYLMGDGQGAVAEIETRHLTPEGVRVLIYASKSLEHPGVHAISRKDNLYETYLYEKVLVEGREKGNKARIPRIAFFATVEDDMLTDTTFIPAAEAEEYVLILMSLGDEKTGTKPVLEHYSTIDNSIWEWI